MNLKLVAHSYRDRKTAGISLAGNAWNYWFSPEGVLTELLGDQYEPVERMDLRILYLPFDKTVLHNLIVRNGLLYLKEFPDLMVEEEQSVT
jgi:hypothetical protein